MKLWKLISIMLAVTLAAMSVDAFYGDQSHSDGMPSTRAAASDRATMQSSGDVSHPAPSNDGNCPRHEKFGCCMSHSGVLHQTGISFTKPNSSSWIELLSQRILGRFIKPRLRPPNQFAAYPNSNQ